MTTALEAGDDALFQQRLQELLWRREEGFYLKIARITGELQKAFEALATDQRWAAIATELPDAGARLEHVARLGEEAAHRTLDLVEAGQRELKALAESAQQLAPLRARLVMAASGSVALGQLAAEAEALERRLQQHQQQLRGQFTALALSQEYQDLSGQILKRVTAVVRDVEAALRKLLAGHLPPQEAPAAADNRLQGPAVPGLASSREAQGQDDADALLALFNL
jgi:chemotaxis protein CheZ